MRTYRYAPGYFLEQFLDRSLPFQVIKSETDAEKFVGLWVLVKTRSNYHNPFHNEAEWPIFIGKIYIEDCCCLKIHRVLTYAPAMNCLLIPWEFNPNWYRYYNPILIRCLTTEEIEKVTIYLNTLSPN